MADILTPPTVSTLPLGLLRYLGIQSGGRFPQTLGELIQPTYDLEQLTAASTDRDFSEIIAVAAVGFNPSTTLLISSAKVTRATLIGCRFTTAAGQAITIALAIQGQSGVTHVVSAPVAVGASSGSGLTATYSPIWLSPGDILGLQCLQLTAGPINVTMTLRKSDYFY